MRENNKKWHSITLQTYIAIMFDTLIYPHNIVTETMKSYTFENEEGCETNPKKGFFAIKDVGGNKTKYFIEHTDVEKMPIRINETEEFYYKDSARCRSIIKKVVDATMFKIIPEECFKDNHQFIDEIAPFNHTEPDQWTLNKLVCLSGYVGKTFTGICSKSEFGKSSIYLIMDALTKKCPVFQPRSVPGVLAQITQDGNMIFDEVHDAPGEVKSCMENFSLQVAGNSPVYVNGAMKSKNTKSKYDVSQQSITYLYNVYSNYSSPDSQFWNFIWSNKVAMESRFLCMQFKGKLLEEFDKNFNISQYAEDNKMYYVRIAKHLMHLKAIKLANEYKRRWSDYSGSIRLTGRHKIIYNEITWMIDLYSRTQQEYEKFVKLLDESINDYRKMIGLNELSTSREGQATIESGYNPKSDQEIILSHLEDGKSYPIDDIEKDLAIMNIDKVINDLKNAGDLFESKPGYVQRI